MHYELKYLSLGEAIGKAFNIYLDNFFPLLIISLITNLPGLFLVYYMLSPNTLFANSSPNLGILYLNLFLICIMTALYIGLITELISKRYLGCHTSLNEYLQSVLPRVLPLIGLSLLVTLCIGLGFIALIIPGIIITLGLFLSPTILIVERRGITESMGRSWDLTKNSRWKIFGWLFVIFTIIFIINFAIGVIFAIITISMASDPANFTKIEPYISQILTILTSPFYNCFIILLYFNLRIQKEGFDLEHLAEHYSISLEEESKEVA